MVKVAIVQMKSSIDKVENLTFSLEQIKKAGNEKAQIICFPEFQMAFSPNSQSSKALFSISESVEDNFIKELCKSAKKNNIYVVGTIYERSFVDSDKLNETSNKRKDVNDHLYCVYDTAVFINDKGALISQYRKLHLYDALNFQGSMKEDHWLNMCKARSLENGVYLIAPNQFGNIYCGRSLIVDPFGIVVLDMGNKEGMEIIDLDIDRVNLIRKDLPLLKNRRTDLYDLK